MTLHLNKIDLNYLYPRILCVKIYWNSSSGCGDFEEDFKKIVNIFSLSRSYLPLKKARPFICIETEVTLPKDVLCQIWFKLDQWFCRRSCQCIFTMSPLSPFDKNRGPSYDKTLIVFGSECFMSIMVEIDSVILYDHGLLNKQTYNK